MVKLRIFYSVNGRNMTTDIDADRKTDTDALREKFRKAYPGCIIHKIKAIKQ